MIFNAQKQQKAWFILFIVAIIFGAWIQTSTAQASLHLVQTAEYDIGFDCPVSSVLDPTGTTVWVLMNSCGDRRHSLRAYNVADGTQVNVDDYADDLVILDGIYIDLFITPLGFTPAGDLSIRYNDLETYASHNVIIPVASGGAVVIQTSATYDALLAEISEYPEFSVYSPDHTRVVVTGGESLHVLDVQAETEIVEIAVEGGAEYALASFSADGQHLHVIRFNNPDDMDDFSSTLLIHSLPDGALLSEYTLPSSAVWVSPDETLAAVQLFSNDIGETSELVIIDLESGLTSPAANLLEDPKPVLTCLNTGNDVSDGGFMTSGYLTLTSLHWLPDNSGIILPLSYNGDGAASSGGNCLFNFSRLRTYSIEAAD
jgi:hypothetical protein